MTKSLLHQNSSGDKKSTGEIATIAFICCYKQNKANNRFLPVITLIPIKYICKQLSTKLRYYELTIYF